MLHFFALTPSLGRRAGSYAHFTCAQGRELYDLCNRAVSSGQRHEVKVTVVVTAPEEFGDEPVAKIIQVMSVKVLGSLGGAMSCDNACLER